MVPIGRCSGCGKRVQGRHSEQTSDALGAAACQLGPNAKSFGTWLHYTMRLSFGRCASVLAHLGVDVTPGALAVSAVATGAALDEVHQEIIAHVNDASVMTADESGWKVAGQHGWLWVATTKEATAYNIAQGRSYDDALALINDDYSGVLVRDGYVVYRSFDLATHQSCAAHLLRRAGHLSEDNPAWARATLIEVQGILTTALDAREASQRTRRRIARNLEERVDALLQIDQSYDANARHVVSEGADPPNKYLRWQQVEHVCQRRSQWRHSSAVLPSRCSSHCR